MKLKFFNPENLDKNLKATVHKTGKLGFTIEAAKKLGLSTEKAVGIAINEDDKDDTNLYIKVYPQKHPGAFNISKAGNYYYVNTKVLFDNLKIDYMKEAIAFDIIEELIEKDIIFKFKRREKQKSGKKLEN